MTAPPRIAVVDYGAGNLRSVAKALVRSGFDAQVTGDPDALRRADAVALPGVGAFSDAMGAAGTYEGSYVGMMDHNVTIITRALGGQAPEKGMQGKLK